MLRIWRWIGIVVVGAMLTVATGCGEDDREGVAEAVCTLAVGVVAEIAEAYRRTQAIGAAIDESSRLLTPICEETLLLLTSRPAVDIVLDLDGAEEPVSFDLGDLQPPPEPAPGSMERRVDCFLSYDAALLADLCNDGFLDPASP